MNEQDIKKAFEQMNPSEKQKQEMWGRILTRKYKKSNDLYALIRNMITVAAVLSMVLLSGMVINAATDGKILSAIKNAFGTEKGETVKEKNDAVLPKFQYTGDDMAMKALVEYFREDDKLLFPPYKGGVWIPAFVIYNQVEREDELIIWGYFWSYKYRLSDKVLLEEGGHGIPACVHLEKNDNEYTVVKAELAKDGTEYASSIKEFTEGYPEVYDIIINGHTEEAQALQLVNRKKYLQMYINDNNLDIRFYKKNIWSEEISIFED